MRCPYGEGMSKDDQCTFEEGHAGPHSYELNDSNVDQKLDIVTATTVYLAKGSVSLNPVAFSALDGDKRLMLNIDYGGERGESLQKAYAFVNIDELELAIKKFKELNDV